MNYDWDWQALSSYWPLIGRGCSTTLGLTAGVIATGTPCGILLALLLRVAPRPLPTFLLLFVDVIRSIPPLVLIFLSYYFLPVILGTGFSAVWIAWIALALYLMAFTADVVRGAFATIPAGVVDAAKAVGLSPQAILWRMELPWVARSIIPTVSLLWIGMLKNSSLASVIGVYELTHTANLIISNTFRSIETYIVVASAYLVIVLPFSVFARRLESTMHRGSPALGNA